MSVTDVDNKATREKTPAVASLWKIGLEKPVVIQVSKIACTIADYNSRTKKVFTTVAKRAKYSDTTNIKLEAVKAYLLKNIPEEPQDIPLKNVPYNVQNQSAGAGW